VGRQLSAISQISDEDGMGSIGYQWLRDDAIIANATQSTYMLTSEDAGAQIRVQASYTDGGGQLESLTSGPLTVARAPAGGGGSVPDTRGVEITTPAAGGTAIGTPFDDQLHGQGGPDVFHPLGGVDRVEGGGGIDTVVFTGSWRDHALSRAENGTLTVTSASGAVATLRNVERLQFDDGRLALDVGVNTVAIAGMYKAAFGRAPDEGGLAYYDALLGQGALSFMQMARDFLASPEFHALYPGLGNAEFVSRLYLNALERQGEPEGQAFHTARLAELPDGDDRAALLIGFALSPEMGDHFAGIGQSGLMLS
jgi:hypothetical protein